MARKFYDNVYYFITVPTVQCFPFFDTVKKKSLILARLEKSKDLFQLEDIDFSIMSTHYHFVSYFRDGRIIPRVLQMVNGGSAYDLNRITDNKKPVWDEYFIYLIDKEALLAKVRGYIVGNPVKHNEVTTLEELEKYPFSSFSTLIKRIEKEQVLSWIQSVILLDDDKFEGEIKT
jgi:hypothetical protein